MSEALTVAMFLARAEEAWQPVLLGGLIPILGLAGLGYLLFRAVRDNDESNE
ncbi:MAG TPA: hypothetical protein VFJ64_06210 [Solirubrobacterales bacterium]|nr:hypothetical protein [Solirubrobacterales bacterium]